MCRHYVAMAPISSAGVKRAAPPSSRRFLLMGEHTVAHFSKRNPFPHSNLDFQVKCLNFKYSSIVKRHFAVHSNYIGRADFTHKQPVCRQCRQHKGNTTSFGRCLYSTFFVNCHRFLHVQKASFACRVRKNNGLIKSHTCKKYGGEHNGIF